MGFLVLPLLDSFVLYAGMLGIKNLWEQHIKFPEGGSYPVELSIYVLPGYICIWVIAIYLMGGYAKPIRSIKSFFGILLGTVAILVVYALLPESLRFSRALILLGCGFGLISLISCRWFYRLVHLNQLVGIPNKGKRIVIVSSLDEFKRISDLLHQSRITVKKLDHLSSISGLEQEKSWSRINKLKEIISVNNINEVIFSAKDLSFRHIMEYMASLDSDKVNFKIAPNESMQIIGSNSSNSIGEYYIIDINSITKPGNIRKKRIFDLAVAVLLLGIFPFAVLVIKNRLQFVSNWLSVIKGACSWVGFSQFTRTNHEQFSTIKKGILNPSDRIVNHSKEETEFEKLDLIYAKDYQIIYDIQIIWKGFQDLGRVVI